MICFKCDKNLEPVFKGSPEQPSDGIICKTWGNYGSTMYDQLDNTHIVFWLCDPCMSTLLDVKGLLFQGHKYCVERK